MKTKQLNGFEMFAYVVTIILTCGAAYGLKCVIQKALSDSTL